MIDLCILVPGACAHKSFIPHHSLSFCYDTLGRSLYCCVRCLFFVLCVSPSFWDIFWILSPQICRRVGTIHIWYFFFIKSSSVQLKGDCLQRNVIQNVHSINSNITEIAQFAYTFDGTAVYLSDVDCLTCETWHQSCCGTNTPISLGQIWRSYKATTFPLPLWASWSSRDPSGQQANSAWELEPVQMDWMINGQREDDELNKLCGSQRGKAFLTFRRSEVILSQEWRWGLRVGAVGRVNHKHHVSHGLPKGNRIILSPTVPRIAESSHCLLLEFHAFDSFGFASLTTLV